MKKAVAAYCRVSTKSNDQENSYENQKSYFERVINNSDTYRLYDIYKDKGVTGTTLEKRPDFNRMLTDAGLDIHNSYRIIAEPKFNIIMTTNTSRFARNVSVDVILKALAQNKVYVHFLDLGKSTENPDDITFIQIFLTFDERESRDKSKKVLFGIEEGIKRGNIHSHGNLFGYKYYPQPENRLEIIDSEAKTIRLLYDLYANKEMGFYRIANYLKLNNIKTRAGKDFTERALRLIITNEVYTGRAVRKKYTEGTVFNKHNRRETGNAIIFETDKIPAIIDIETFNKAQDILHSRIQHTSQRGKYNGKTPYAGKIICGCCGALYTAGNSDYLAEFGKQVRCYTCKSKRAVSYDESGNRIRQCNNPNVYETLLDPLVTYEAFAYKLYEKLMMSILLLESLIVYLMNRIDKKDIVQIDATQKELDLILEQKQKLLDLYFDSNFSKEELDRRAEPLAQQENDLREKIKELSKNNDEIQADIEALEETIKDFREQSKKYDLYFDEVEKGNIKSCSKEELLKDIESITIQPDKTISIRYKFVNEINRIIAKHRHAMPEELKNKFNNFI